ncbi:MAG: hypothetical protein KME21_14780 [Desmonostoc vinosum HA7617-LM4]|jgi:hypothetical protein|nr:hypothetical protein [Desmonostoc vinosum HA7617-LM4]
MNPPATVNRKLSKTTVLALLTLGFVGFNIQTVFAQNSLDKAAESNSYTNGTYLYGETPQSNQIQKGYLVFQRQQGKIVGAFYYPNSEFSCFTGKQANNTLFGKTIGSGNPTVQNVKINLQNFHQIDSVSNLDQRVLSVCKQATAELVNR